MKTVNCKWLGYTAYKDALEEQIHSWNQVHDKGGAVILGVEHPSVITLGKRGIGGIDILVPQETLRARGVEVAEIDRGGQATLHSPGQLVIYPIVALRNFNIGVREFVALLEETTINWLATKGIKASGGHEEPGIYTDKGKITFVGLRIDRGISRHGISINISNDVSLFDLIRSCGKSSEHFDLVSNYEKNKTLEEHFNDWYSIFVEKLTK